MEIEKILTVTAPPQKVWALLLDPAVMGSCVPGMKSIEVVSDVEYLAEMHVKIAFVSARFKIKTTIVETRPPFYLRSEGTGEDASVASSLKQVSEIFLTELPDGQTELRMKIKVDVLGRLGTFGLSVMKTKADRMWDEFGVNLAVRLAPAPALPADTEPAPAAPAESAGADLAASRAQQGSAQGASPVLQAGQRTDLADAATSTRNTGWWSRLFASPSTNKQPSDSGSIFVEVRRADSIVTVRWPVQSANECALWLRDYLK